MVKSLRIGIIYESFTFGAVKKVILHFVDKQMFIIFVTIDLLDVGNQ